MVKIERPQLGIIFKAVVDSCFMATTIHRQIDIIDASWIAQRAIDNILKTQEE